MILADPPSPPIMEFSINFLIFFNPSLMNSKIDEIAEFLKNWLYAFEKSPSCKYILGKIIGNIL